MFDIRILERVASHGFHDRLGEECGGPTVLDWALSVAEGLAEHDDEFDDVGGRMPYLKLTERGYELLHRYYQYNRNHSLARASRRMVELETTREATRERRRDLAWVDRWLKSGFSEDEVRTKLKALRTEQRGS